MLFNQNDRKLFSAIAAPFNPPLNLAPFGRWTLRDKAAQRRLLQRWAAIQLHNTVNQKEKSLCITKP